jgi:hypothetical protein
MIRAIREFDRALTKAWNDRTMARSLALGVLEGARTAFAAAVLDEVIDITNDDYVEALAMAAEAFLRSEKS